MISYYETNNSGISDIEIQDVINKEFKDKKDIWKNVLLVVPDYTRLPSNAGRIVNAIINELDKTNIKILVACGTHNPMSDSQLDMQYPGIDHGLFSFHNWREDVIKVGEVDGNYIDSVSNGLWTDSMDVCLNKMLYEPWDQIISIGQVVPHEVVGMSNYTKNFAVGCGGADFINSTHILGAFCGLEQIMGKDNSPVRKVYDYVEENFISKLPVTYVFTVTSGSDEKVTLRGLFVGKTRKTFEDAVKLSQKENMIFLEKPIKKCVVYLNPKEFHTLWLGNKAIYRTRMAMEDNGELIILAPGVTTFGEDLNNDKMIRKYGYIGRTALIKCCKDKENCADLRENLSAAAHLIHGSSDGRFNITYCTDKKMEEEIKAVNFNWANVDDMMKKYDPNKLIDGINIVDNEEIFYISNPAIGLWSSIQRFKQNQGEQK